MDNIALAKRLINPHDGTGSHCRPMDLLGSDDRVVVLDTETIEIKENGATVTGLALGRSSR